MLLFNLFLCDSGPLLSVACCVGEWGGESERDEEEREGGGGWEIGREGDEVLKGEERIEGYRIEWVSIGLRGSSS